MAEVITRVRVKRPDGTMSDPIPFGIESSHLHMTAGGTLDEIIEKQNTNLNNHIKSKENPHGVTKKQVGLEKVENYAVASTSEATAGASNTTYMTPARVKEEMNALGVMSDGNLIIKVGGSQPPVQSGKTIIWINTAE